VAKVLIAEDTGLEAALLSVVSGLGHEAVLAPPRTVLQTLSRQRFDLLITDSPALLGAATVPTLVVSGARAPELRSASPPSRRAEQGRYGALIGAAPAMQRVFGLIDRLSGTDTPVLVLGEEGTGKELVAREIHKRSKRHAMPFVAFNCAAVTETLLERELFGHGEDAFEGAGEVEGKLCAADGGTVSLSTQVRFLELLRSGRIQPAGGEPRQVDVRVVAATHRDLKTMVEAGEFREDFYYQLNVVSIDTPPLRDRREDIPSLAEAVLTRLAESKGLRGVLSPEVPPLFQTYLWPGNVRELENVIEHALLLADAGPEGNRTITAANLPPDLVTGTGRSTETGLVAQIERIEREILRNALEEADWNQSRTARALQLKRSSLQYKMKKYDLARP
jgi:DNA-binding NtrC family response regulator